MDNRGSHFYLALYWAEALASQQKDTALQNQFKKAYLQLHQNKEVILKELLDAQGTPQDIDGYYIPTLALVNKQMKPSGTFNSILENIN